MRGSNSELNAIRSLGRHTLAREKAGMSNARNRRGLSADWETTLAAAVIAALAVADVLPQIPW